MILFDQMPVAGPITGTFGQWYGTYQHRGVDIGCPVGTPVVNPSVEQVKVAMMTQDPNHSSGFGKHIRLELPNGQYFVLAHLDVIDGKLTPGTVVYPAQHVGLSGNTGKSTGPHLHWQLCDQLYMPTDIKYSHDPLKYLEEGDAMTIDELAEQVELLALAIASGDEEASLPRDQRVTNAWYRITEIAAAARSSALEQGRSAEIVAHEHFHKGLYKTGPAELED